MTQVARGWNLGPVYVIYVTMEEMIRTPMLEGTL